tara:strand:- start:191 stop:565 length:375 start_codon:yes stop_codon:yes gene_type:complete
MALVTSSSSESLQIKTARHEWMNCFSTKVLGDDKLLERGKPSPDPYLLAAKKLNVRPQDCWVVEDSISGVSSALSAECNVFFLRERNDDLTIEKFSKKTKNLKEIHYLKDIEKMLNEYQINKAY